MSLPSIALSPAGQFGFVSLLDSQRLAIEFECIVLEVSFGDGTAVVGTPGSALPAESGEWVETTAEAIADRTGGVSGPQLTVLGWDHAIVLKRVSHQAVSSASVGQNSLRRFVTGELNPARPPIRGTMAAYFRQDELVSASETDGGATLCLENQRLRAALRAALASGRPGSSRYVAPMAQSALPATVHFGDESCEAEREESKEEDLCGSRMSIPMRFHSQRRPKSRAAAQRQRPGFAQGSVDGAANPVPAPRADDPQAVQMTLMFEMLKVLQERRGGGTGDTGDLDAPDGQKLDVVRVLRTLSRMRALQTQLRPDPDCAFREYKTKDDLKSRTKAARNRTAIEGLSDNEEEKPDKKAGEKTKK